MGILWAHMSAIVCIAFHTEFKRWDMDSDLYTMHTVLHMVVKVQGILYSMKLQYEIL